MRRGRAAGMPRPGRLPEPGLRCPKELGSPVMRRNRRFHRVGADVEGRGYGSSGEERGGAPDRGGGRRLRVVEAGTAMGAPAGAADRRGVEAVTAWEFPTVYGYPAPIIDVNLEEIATKAVRDAITEATGGAETGPVRYMMAEGMPPECCWMHRLALTCWWSAAAATAGSSRRCLAPPGNTACTLPRARSW